MKIKNLAKFIPFQAILLFILQIATDLFFEKLSKIKNHKFDFLFSRKSQAIVERFYRFYNEIARQYNGESETETKKQSDIW